MNNAFQLLTCRAAPPPCWPLCMSLSIFTNRFWEHQVSSNGWRRSVAWWEVHAISHVWADYWYRGFVFDRVRLESKIAWFTFGQFYYGLTLAPALHEGGRSWFLWTRRCCSLRRFGKFSKNRIAYRYHFSLKELFHRLLRRLSMGSELRWYTLEKGGISQTCLPKIGLFGWR